MKSHILALVGFAIDNILAIGGGVYLGHRFVTKIDKIYEIVEAVVSKVYGLIRGAKKVAAAVSPK